jgi:RNA polymerase sigma-70 factor, ECF subfamily
MGRFLRGAMGVRDVDDLVQSVFLEFLSSIGSFRHDSSLATWLYTIARRVVYRSIRTESRRRRKHRAVAEVTQASGWSQGDPDALRRAEARSQLRVVSEVLASMDERYRMVWVLREMEGLGNDQIAEILDVRLPTVRTRYFRARAKIVDALEQAEQAEKEAKASKRRAQGWSGARVERAS